MGCWYETCSVTDLPILPGEECYLVKFQEDPTHFWDHAYLLIRTIEGIHLGEYNDYGALETVDTEPDGIHLFFRKDVWDDIASKPGAEEIIDHINNDRLEFFKDKTLLTKLEKDFLKVRRFCFLTRHNMDTEGFRGHQTCKLEMYDAKIALMQTEISKLKKHIEEWNV